MPIQTHERFQIPAPKPRGFYVYKIFANGVPVYIGSSGYLYRLSNHHSCVFGKPQQAIHQFLRNVIDDGGAVEAQIVVDGLDSRAAAEKVEARLVKQIGRRDQRRGPLLNRDIGGRVRRRVIPKSS